MPLSKREKILLGFLGVCIVFFLFHRFVYLPETSLLNTLEADIERDRQTLVRLEETVETGGDLAASVSPMKLRMLEMDRILPAMVCQEEVILYLEKMLARHDLAATNLSFAANSPNSALWEPPQADSIHRLISDYESGKSAGSPEKPPAPSTRGGWDETLQEEPSVKGFEVAITFTGTYADVKAFVNQIESNPRLIRIRTLGMFQESGRMRGEMVLSFPFYAEGTPGPVE